MDRQQVQAVSYMLSTFTILSCVFLKIPQIMYIRKKQSAEGIYIQAMLMEITGFTIVTLYNFTNHYGVMTYLEYPIILLQVYVLLFYTMKYKGMLSMPLLPLITFAYATTVALFTLGILPNYLLSYMVPLVTPLSGFAKVTYIFGIIKAGNADAVSPTTWYISIFTNVARLFTIYVDSADTKLMFNLTTSSLLSTSVLFTALYYQYNSNTSVRLYNHQHHHRHSRSGHNHTDHNHVEEHNHAENNRRRHSDRNHKHED